jgi:chitinase
MSSAKRTGAVPILEDEVRYSSLCRAAPRLLHKTEDSSVEAFLPRNMFSYLALLILVTSLAPLTVLSQTPTCSATEECAIGCCGKFGVCGLGPEFCGAGNCTSTCNQKSECDPGWGPEWSAHEKCPLDVCCSRFGFCGTTPDFCGDEVITNPSCSGSSASKRTLGYYEAWSTTRPCDVMQPEEINVQSYTHLNFAFASIDPVTFAIAQMNPGDTDLYARLVNLKVSNPNLQVRICDATAESLTKDFN